MMGKGSEMRILGVITARGGSKGIPGKNIKTLGRKPLIAWSIEECSKSMRITDLVVSTDDDRIAKVARKYGGSVPFMRPKELAEDTTLHVPVMQHAVAEMEKIGGKMYDYVVILQPTSPFRKVIDLDATIDLALREKADSAVTVYQIDPAFHPMKIKRLDGNMVFPYSVEEPPTGMRRQDYPPAYKRSGEVFLVKRDILMHEGVIYGKRTVGYVVERENVLDIDSFNDWIEAEKRQLEMSKN